MSDSPPLTLFRALMDHLHSQTGDAPQWPWLFHEMVAREYRRERDRGVSYSGDIFKDRDDDRSVALKPEPKSVRELYQLCKNNARGCLTIDRSAYWLLGWEWPNQGSERGRRADLVGLNVQGGLTVFECKLEGNSETPFTALLQGLDYLACLTSEPSMLKIQQGFDAWKAKPDVIPPERFEQCEPNSDAVSEVIVMAPSGYYDQHCRSRRGEGWNTLADHTRTEANMLAMRFAVTDFHSTKATWYSSSTLKRGSK